MKRFLKIVSAAAALAAVQLPHVASACSACMGDPNTNIAKGANAAIFLMLGILAGMFSLIGGFVYHIYKQSKMPSPPHVELGGGFEGQPQTGLK